MNICLINYEQLSRGLWPFLHHGNIQFSLAVSKKLSSSLSISMFIFLLVFREAVTQQRQVECVKWVMTD